MNRRDKTPATVREARRLRYSPFRRIFGNRFIRLIWVIALIGAGGAGVWLGARTLYLPDAPDTRHLIPANTLAPAYWIEIREGSTLWRRYQSDPTAAALFKQPIFQTFQQSPDWMMLEDALRPAPDKKPGYGMLGYVLGDDATFVSYRPPTGTTGFLLIAKTHPLAKAQLAWVMAQPSLKTKWQATASVIMGVQVMEIHATQPPLFVAFVGRLGFCSNQRDLLEAAIGSYRGAEGFLALGNERLRIRLDGQPHDRAGSFYLSGVAGDGSRRETYGAVSVSGNKWTTDVWAVGSYGSPTAENMRDAKSMATRIPPTNPLVAWHSRVSDIWLMRELPAQLSLSWQPTYAVNPVGGRPVALTVAPPSGDTQLVPNLATLIGVRSGNAIKGAVRSGGVAVRWNGSRLRIKGGQLADAFNLPLGMGIEYPVGFGATERALVIAASPGLVGDLTASPTITSATELAQNSPTTADLFYIHARPKELSGAGEKLFGMIALGAKASGDASTQTQLDAWRDHVALMRFFSEFKAEGWSTGDGIHALASATLTTGTP